jgi:hypothetical protein
MKDGKPVPVIATIRDAGDGKHLLPSEYRAVTVRRMDRRPSPEPVYAILRDL